MEECLSIPNHSSEAATWKYLLWFQCHKICAFSTRLCSWTMFYLRYKNAMTSRSTEASCIGASPVVLYSHRHSFFTVIATRSKPPWLPHSFLPRYITLVCHKNNLKQAFKMLYPDMTSTAMFLSCTPPPVFQTLPPAKHTTLSPVTQTMYTTVYETVLPAACETSQWMTTYTVTETYPSKPDVYVTPTIPQGFVVTTVVCPDCKPTELVVTRPAETPTVSVITNNGVATTITVHPTGALSMSAAYPTGTKKTPSTITAVPGKSSYPDSGPNYPVPGCSGSRCAKSGVASPEPDVASPEPDVASPEPGVTSPKPGVAGPASCGSSGCNGTSTTPLPAVITAGAPPLKGALELLSGLALLAAHFFLL
ncbi:hypothetical protein F4818DRAFT_412521 [Hypoxylon cercidicola]|nr:hypothetical protein F4818DRAFT_412521 [Hypoxylon cercidicola]